MGPGEEKRCFFAIVVRAIGDWWIRFSLGERGVGGTAFTTAGRVDIVLAAREGLSSIASPSDEIVAFLFLPDAEEVVEGAVSIGGG